MKTTKKMKNIIESNPTNIIFICERCGRRSKVWDDEKRDFVCIWEGLGCEKLKRGEHFWRKRFGVRGR